MLADSFHCHPALALSAYLCDMPLYDGIAIIFERQTLKLEIASVYGIQPRTVLKAYSLGQREILNLTPKKQRRRGRGIRTMVLYRYPNMTPRLTWEQRWQEWNRQFPQWRYNDVQTMVSAYSRVRREEETNKAWLEQIREELGVGQWEMELTTQALKEVQR